MCGPARRPAQQQKQQTLCRHNGKAPPVSPGPDTLWAEDYSPREDCPLATLLDAPPDLVDHKSAPSPEYWQRAQEILRQSELPVLAAEIPDRPAAEVARSTARGTTVDRSIASLSIRPYGCATASSLTCTRWRTTRASTFDRSPYPLSLSFRSSEAARKHEATSGAVLFVPTEVTTRAAATRAGTATCLAHRFLCRT